MLAGALLLILVVKGWLLHPSFYLLTGVVGAGLLAAGLADRQRLRRILLALPWNRGAGRRAAPQGTP